MRNFPDKKASSGKMAESQRKGAEKRTLPELDDPEWIIGVMKISGRAKKRRAESIP